jgi:hypothetical protein
MLNKKTHKAQKVQKKLKKKLKKAPKKLKKVPKCAQNSPEAFHSPPFVYLSLSPGKSGRKRTQTCTPAVSSAILYIKNQILLLKKGVFEPQNRKSRGKKVKTIPRNLGNMKSL